MKGAVPLQTNATLVDVTLQYNLAMRAGALYNSGELTISMALVSRNNATGHDGDVGPALYNTGTAFLTDQTEVRDNRAVGLSGADLIWGLYNGGTLFYVMPAPLGHYMPGQFQCKKEYCETAGAEHRVECQVQSCKDSAGNFLERYAGQQMASIRQGVIQVETPKRCVAGYYGNSLDTKSQLSFSCAGPCPRGQLCSRSGLAFPEACPAGYWCESGSKTPTPCAELTKYCPENSSNPKLVPTGYYSIGGVSSSYRTGIAECPPNHWCDQGVSHECPHNTTTKTPASSRTSSFSCEGTCPTNAHMNATTRECKCNHPYLEDTDIETGKLERCVKEIPFLLDGRTLAGLLGWGVPAWLSFAAILVAAVNILQKRWTRLSPSVTNIVRNALWHNQSQDIQSQWAARPTATISLVYMARLVNLVAIGCMPNFPAVLAIWSLYPLALAHPEAKREGLSPALSRATLLETRSRLFWIAGLGGYVYPLWLVLFCAFPPFMPIPDGHYTSGDYNLLWYFLASQVVSDAGCMEFSAETLSHQLKPSCYDTFFMYGVTSIMHAMASLILANLALVMMVMLSDRGRGAFDRLTQTHLPRFARWLPVQTRIALIGASFFIPVAPVLFTVASHTSHMRTLTIVACLCFVALPLSCAALVYFLARTGRLAAYTELNPMRCEQALGADPRLSEKKPRAAQKHTGSLLEHSQVSTRFVGEAKDIVVGRPVESAIGLFDFIQADEARVKSAIDKRGVQAVQDEWEAALVNGRATQKDLENLRCAPPSPHLKARTYSFPTRAEPPS